METFTGAGYRIHRMQFIRLLCAKGRPHFKCWIIGQTPDGGEYLTLEAAPVAHGAATDD